MANYDAATTWRDLADQLTPKQIASLDTAEQRFRKGGIGDCAEGRESLLGFARDYAEGNLVDVMYGDVAVPAGARTEPCGWEKNLDTGRWSRSLVWHGWDGVTKGVDVEIDGRQECDGSFTRRISLWASDGAALDSDQARRLAAQLAAAADELDALGGAC